jgi:hypothetical protein
MPCGGSAATGEAGWFVIQIKCTFAVDNDN